MLLIMLSYILSIFLYILYLRFAGRKSFRQTEREEGPKNHKAKNGTITAGGLVFVVVSSILFIVLNGFNRLTYFLLVPFISYFLIGFIDDFLIITKKKNDGLKPKKKLIIEITLGFIFYGLYYLINKRTSIAINNVLINLNLFYIILFVFLFVASANTFNITDGLDGLLVGLSIEILLALFFIADSKNEVEVMTFILIIVASLSSFYFFNYPKAYIFMGDTGSLALGALILSISIYLEVEWIFVILALPLIFETISVILQVLFFKLTKGKRLFKMAPFHHHLEALGYSEKMITTMFLLIETILVLISLYLYNIF